MRTKSFTALALCTLALVGCSTSEAEPGQSTATEQPAATPEPSASATPSVDPEEAFIAQVEIQIDGKEDALESELPAKKLTEEYWLERGEIYCEQMERDALELPRLKSALENQWEGQLASAAMTALCPSS